MYTLDASVWVNGFDYKEPGADAVYAAVALRARCTLISLDAEHLTRLHAIVRTMTPAAALESLQREP